MPTPSPMIHITARNLARALRLAEGQSKIEQALDPTEKAGSVMDSIYNSLLPQR